MKRRSVTVAPRKYADVLAAVLGSRGSVEVIEGAGHALLPEQPEKVAEALGRWVRRMQ